MLNDVLMPTSSPKGQKFHNRKQHTKTREYKNQKRQSKHCKKEQKKVRQKPTLKNDWSARASFR
jgi:hypothetical protein